MIPGVAFASCREAHEMDFSVPDLDCAGVPVGLRWRGFGNRFPLGTSPRESGHRDPGDRFDPPGVSRRRQPGPFRGTDVRKHVLSRRPPVAWNDSLAIAAYLHSEDMATNQFFSHTGSDGSSPGDRITREGYAWWTYGENIAVGYPTVSAVMQGWLGSDGHCRNIMNPAFREIGAAYAEGPYLGNPSAPYWTFDLATPR